MKKLLLLLFTALFLFAACGKTQTTGTNAEEAQELTFVYASEIPSLNYYTQGSEVTYATIAEMVDGLVEFNKYGVLIPAIAQSWENSADGLVWTFRLRNDVTWVDYKGDFAANVTAHDFVSAAKYNLDEANASYYLDFYTAYFVNAEAYYESTVPDYSGPPVAFADVGIKALNDYTLQYTLMEPVPYFMSMINWVPFYPVYGPFIDQVGSEFGISHDKLLYCGAMRMESWRPQNERVYVKNSSYYLANEIHITKETYTYNAEAIVIAPELFRRGDVNYADISSAILDEWLADPNLSKLIRPSTPLWYSYFYAFNFDPHFPAEYEPDNWKKAVNNRNFRKAVFHAFDRMAAMYTADPHNPQNHIIKSITPPAFCNVGGLDFTQTGDMARITNQLATYDTALAQQYRDAARTELRSAGVTLPVKVLMPYNSAGTEWAQRVQVVKQNIERVLGADFIEIVIFNAPPTNFLGDNRRNGRFALLEVNWGPDYSDPETFSDPFNLNGTYNKPQFAEEYIEANGLTTYHNLLNEAKAEKTNLVRRFELFAKAEAFLIDEALVIPYSKSVPVWVASYLNPFDYNFSSGSMSYAKINNVRKLANPIGAEEYNNLLNQWNRERDAALRASGQ